jgi:hypothetical protein
MANDALVTADIESAARLVKFLDENNMPVSGALWLYQSEAERWRLLISFQEERKDISKFYLDVAKLINKSLDRDKMIELSKVDFVEASKSVIGPLSKIVHIDGISQVRFSHNRVNGIYIEDALIYRLAA